MRSTLALLMVVLIGACVAGTGGPRRVGSSDGKRTGRTAVPLARDAWRLCVSDLDCVSVPGDCCGCAAGGFDEAIAVTHADARAAELRASCRGPVACTDYGTASCDQRPLCREGRCTLD